MAGRRIRGISTTVRAATVMIFTAAILGVHTAGACGEPVVLSLERAIELGLENDEALRQAGMAVTTAEAQVTQAKSAALPQLSVTGQYGRNILKPAFFLPEEFREDPDSPAKVEIGEDNDFYGAANLTQILWAAGRVSAGLAAARQYLSSFRYRQTAASDYVRFSVKEAYFGVLLASEFVRIAEKAMQETEEAMRVARAGFAEGTISRFDVMRAEVELANRRVPLVAARNALDQAMIVLRRRCGLEPDTAVALTDSLTAVDHAYDLETLLAAMRAKSADIKTIEHTIEARKQFLRIARAERYPMLRLNAYYAIQSQWSKNFLPEGALVAKIAAVQVGLQIPIFDGFNAKGKIRESRANLRVAELELDRVTRDKEIAVQQARLNLESALTAFEGRRETVRLAEEAYRLALVRLRNGLATPLERLDAELAMTTARGHLAEALYSCSMARAYLELAVGTDGFNDVESMQ
ncbi:MAG TPA: TolC family protein [Patescibacteria group bacterium]|nr:TolC family protein [Patescibacteria group bacterium]